MIRSTRVLAGGLAALLCATETQACFVVANGTITFNSMVSPPGCGGIPNAFPTQGAAQTFLNAQQSTTTSGGGTTTSTAPATAPATTTVTGAAAAMPMPSTAMQVFMLTTPDKAAAVNHERLLYDTMLDHPNRRPFLELGVATALITGEMVQFTNLFFYHWQIRGQAVRAEWDMTPEGQEARRQGKEAADRAYYESDLFKSFDAGMKEQQAFAANSGLFFLEDDGRSSSQADRDSVFLDPPDVGILGPPIDGPPESILDSIGDFVPIS